MVDLYNADCLEKMCDIPDSSIDLILCDLPYGTTSCKWDTIIPFDRLWSHYNRVIKPNGAVLLFGQEPFSSNLRLSNIKDYRYDWIWEKTKYSNFLCLKKQPAKNFENICVFYKKQPTYNPQMREGKPYVDRTGRKLKPDKESLGNQQIYGVREFVPRVNDGKRYPSCVVAFSNGNNHNVHPTQKPVELLEYLIKTYTNEDETVLDNCMGSGSTGVACVNTNRNFIGIEIDTAYFEIARDRIFDSMKSSGFKRTELI